VVAVVVLMLLVETHQAQIAILAFLVTEVMVFLLPSQVPL
jgi:hypothetical protein